MRGFIHSLDKPFRNQLDNIPQIHTGKLELFGVFWALDGFVGLQDRRIGGSGGKDAETGVEEGFGGVGGVDVCLEDSAEKT